VLRATLRRQLRRIPRNEREWRLFIGPVLGKIEMHSADEMPDGIAISEKFLERSLNCREGKARYLPHPCSRRGAVLREAGRTCALPQSRLCRRWPIGLTHRLKKASSTPLPR
jgi:hypothetical protein